MAEPRIKAAVEKHHQSGMRKCAHDERYHAWTCSLCSREVARECLEALVREAEEVIRTLAEKKFRTAPLYRDTLHLGADKILEHFGLDPKEKKER